MRLTKREFPLLLISFLCFLKPFDHLSLNRSRAVISDQAIITYTWHNPEDRDQPVLFSLFCNKRRAHFLAASEPDKYDQFFIDYPKQAVIRILKNTNRRKPATVSSFKDFASGEETHAELKVLGHVCSKFRYINLTDTLDVWVWKQGELRGSPVFNLLNPQGLVLRIDKNTVPLFIALTIQYKKISDHEFGWPKKVGPFISSRQYEDIKRKSTEILIPVFQHEQIGFHAQEKQRSLPYSSSTFHYAGGTVIVRQVKLPSIKNDYSVFAELTDYSNGDAMPRQGTVFIIPVDKRLSMLDALDKGFKVLPGFKSVNGKIYNGFLKTAIYNPLIELMRFTTPYGIRAFNKTPSLDDSKWADSVTWKQDISDLKSELVSEVYIGTYIHGNNPLGQIISLNLRFYPLPQTIEKQRIYVQPLFNTVSVLQAAGQEPGTLFQGDSLHLKFTLPVGLQDLSFRYLSSGEGLYPDGEAFRQRINQVFWDDDEILKVTPWRTDCGTFRAYNPASPIATNGLVQSDLSRAGFCPGSITLPVSINLDDPEAGIHEIRVVIPMGGVEAAASGFWNVSGVLIGHYGPKTDFLHRKARHRLLQDQ